MKDDDVRGALAQLGAEANRLAEAVGAADGRAGPVVLAEVIVAADRGARRLARLREQLRPKGKGGGK